MVTEKRCTKCGLVKPLDHFYVHRQGLYGRRSWCKVCQSEYAKNRAKDPEVQARRREYHARPEVRARRHTYEAAWRQRPEVKAKRAAYDARYHRTNYVPHARLDSWTAAEDTLVALDMPTPALMQTLADAGYARTYKAVQMRRSKLRLKGTPISDRRVNPPPSSPTTLMHL